MIEGQAVDNHAVMVVFFLFMLIPLLVLMFSSMPTPRRAVADESVQWLNGSNLAIGTYLMVTLDGGRNWYDVERIGAELRMLGPADPAKLRQVLAMRELGNRSFNGKPFDPTLPADRATLEAAGFTVTPRSS